MALSLFDYIKWSGEIGVLAFRHPKNNIGKYTKLQVSEAQEAVIIVNGERSQKFGAGTHELNSPNVPILKEFYGIPYGGENPWVVQAWFINKLMPMDIEWETDSFTIFDDSFGAAIPIAASGRYGITIVNAERFILKLCLGYPSIGKEGVKVTADNFTEQLYGELMVHTKSIITKVMAANKISITAISAHLEDFSKYIESQINNFFEDYGCKLLKLYVTDISIDKSSESGRRISESIDQQTVQRISGHTWQQNKMFETVDKAMSGTSGSGGLLGSMMAVSMMSGGGAGFMGGQSLMTPQYGQPTCAPVNSDSTNATQELAQRTVKDVYCSNCSKRFSSNMQYCPHCGDMYSPCPKCGSDNDANATRCVNCGTQLKSNASLVCEGCGKTINPNSSFCSNCGRPTAVLGSCPRCNSNVGNSAFCPMCGFKIK